MRLVNKKRVGIFLALVLLALLAAVAMFFDIGAYLRGEAFFEGRPSSYWSKHLKEGTNWETPYWVNWVRFHFGYNIVPRTAEEALHTKDRSVVPVLSDLLDDQAGPVRQRAISRLWGNSQDNKDELFLNGAVEALAKALNDADMQNRELAARYLDELLNSLANKNRRSAAATPHLIEALGNQNRHVRSYAARSLSFVAPDPRVIPALIKVIEDKNEDREVRATARGSVDRIDPELGKKLMYRHGV